MAENPSALTTPEEFHQGVVKLVDAQVDRDQRAGKATAEIRPHPEGGEAFERELADRMVVRRRNATNSPTLRTRTVTSTTTKSSGGGKGGPVLIILVLILALAGYIAFFENDSSGDDSGELAGDAVVPRTVIPEPSRRSTGPINFFNVAIDGFDQLLAGRLRPEIQEKSFDQLKRLLEEELGTSIAFAGSSGPLVGGDITTVRTLKIPRFMYRDDETVILVTEVSWEDLRNENGVYVAQDVLAQLESGQSVATPGPSNGTLMLYRDGDRAVIAAANRSEPDLLRLLGR